MKAHDADHVVLMELNSRPPGDSILDMIESASGLNVFEMHAKCYLQSGYSPEPIALKGRAAIAFMNAPAGTVRGVELPPAATLPDTIVAVHAWRRPGDITVQSHDSNSRDGSVQFYWPEDPGDLFLREHLCQAESLTKQIYRVERTGTP